MYALGAWVTIASAGDGIGYDPPRNFAELAAAVAAVSGLVVLVGIAARMTLRAYRAVHKALHWVESIHELTERQLELDNGDGTVAEELHGIAVSMGRLQRRADQLARKVDGNSKRLDRVESDLRAIYDPHHRNRPREQETDI